MDGIGALFVSMNEVNVPCPAPELKTKTLSDGTVVFFWTDPAPPCGIFSARATAHPDPDNAPPESFETLQPTLSTRQIVPSLINPGRILLGPTIKSVLVGPRDPWTAVELFQRTNESNPT